MEKIVLPLLSLLFLTACTQIQELKPVPGVQPQAEQLSFFDAVEAIKQRYFTLSQQLEDGTYAQDASWYYQLPTEIKKERFYFLAGVNSIQMAKDSFTSDLNLYLALPVFSSMEALNKETWEYYVPNRSNIIPITHIGEDISLWTLSDWTPHNVRLPVRLPTKYYLNTHLVGKVKKNSITIRVITEKHSPDMNSEMMDMGEKTFEFSAGENFDINPWEDEELRPTNAIKDHIYFTISSADWGVFDYEFKF